MVGGEGGHQLHDDGRGGGGGQPPGSVMNSDPGGGLRLTTSRTKMLCPRRILIGRLGSYEEHVCFPLEQGLVEQPVLQPAGRWSA